MQEGFKGNPADLDFTEKKFLFFPIMGQNVDASAPQDTVLFGICVKDCPMQISQFQKCGCLKSGVVSASDKMGAGMFPTFAFGCGDYTAPSAWKTATLTTPPAVAGMPHDCVCKNDGSKCYDVSFPTKEIMYRCIPWSDANKTVVLSCLDTDGNNVDVESDNCRTILQKETSISQKPKVELPIVDQLQGFATTAGMYLNDVTMTWRFIVGIGGGLAVFLGFMWLMLMKMFAGIIVWATIVALVVMELLGAFVCAMKSGMLTMDDLNAAAEAACERTKTQEQPDGDPELCFNPDEAAAKLEAEGGSEAFSVDQSTQKNFEYGFYALAICTILTIVIVILKRKAIQIAVGIIKEASDAIKSMPLLVAFPVLPFSLVIILVAYFLAGAAFIYTAENVSMDDLSNTLDAMGNASSGLVDAGLNAAGVNQTALLEEMARLEAEAAAQVAQAQADLAASTGVNLTQLALEAEEKAAQAAADAAAAANAGMMNSTDNATAGAVAAILDGNLVQKGMLAYHLFGFLWTNQFLMAVAMMTISGAVCSWYWVLDKSYTPKLAISEALWRTCRYHIGSCAFGALIIAIVQFLRIVLQYLDNKTKKLQEKNKFLKYAFMILKCCMWCFEKVVKFISKNAYIMVAMKGSSFCSATKASFLLILANLAQVAMVTVIAAY